MLRLGVDRLSQYPPSWLRIGHLDYRLLRTAIPPSPLEVQVFEDITRRMLLSNGVYRTTSPSRLRDLDEWATGLLAKAFPSATPLAVEDWAASDCSTSVAWHPVLLGAFPQAQLTASDLNVYLLEMTGGGRGTYILDAALGLLQYVNPPFVIRLRPAESPVLAVNWWLARRALARFKRLQQQNAFGPADIRFPPGADELRYRDLLFRSIPLVHPSATALRHAASSFRIKRHSIFDAAETPVDVIRSMNILNVSYFDPPTLEKGVRTIWSSLKPGGWWIVGRTVQDNPPVHHTSILIKTADGFRLHERFNEKSEVEDLALKVRM